MSDMSEWRRALELLEPGEARELEALMQRRAERTAQRAPAAVRSRKRAAAPEAGAAPSSAPEAAPRQADNRIWFIPSDPNDRLGDFRDKSPAATDMRCYIDGV